MVPAGVEMQYRARDLKFDVPHGKFVLYLCSGNKRVGDLSDQLAKSDLGCVMVDASIGRNRHDLTHEDVAAAL